MAAVQVDAAALRDSGHTGIAELVSADGLSPTAVGATTAGDGSGTRPVAWELSQDQVWTSVEVAAPEEAWLTDVAPGPDGPVATGVVRVDGRNRAATWSRTDEGWAGPVEIGDVDGRSTLDDIAGDGATLLAHGTVDPPGDEPAAARNAVWVSTDGGSWRRVEVPGTDEEGTGLADVAVGRGGLAVVGSRTDGETSTARAWVSDDEGATWLEVALDAPSGSAIGVVVALGDGFVAGGSVTPGATSVPATWRGGVGEWTGPDTALPTPETSLATTGGSSVQALTSRNGVVLATNGSSARPEVWSSTTGAGWVPWPTPVSATTGYASLVDVTDIAVDGEGQPVVSVASGPNLLVPGDGAWVEAPGAADVLPVDQEQVVLSDVAVHDGRLVVTGTASTPDRPGRPGVVQAVFWSRGSDDDWARVVPDDLAGQVYGAMASTDLGLVAVGLESLRLDTEGTSDGAVAVSPDARAWEVVRGAEAAVVRTLGDVAPWRGGWLAVGVRLDVEGASADGVARPVRAMLRGNTTTGASRSLTVDLGAIATPDGATEWLGGLCTGAGGIVVVGSTVGPTGRRTPMVARADDFESGWQVATADDDFASGRLGQELDDCAVDGRQELLLHGSVTADDGEVEPLVWRSADGAGWARLGSDAWGGAGAQQVAEVAALDEGWVAGGSETTDGAAGADAALWLVDEADEVHRVPLAGDLVGPDDQEVTSVAVREDTVVLVGRDEGVPAVWELPLAEVRAAVGG